jgi:hypothetical protein
MYLQLRIKALRLIFKLQNVGDILMAKNQALKKQPLLGG